MTIRSTPPLGDTDISTEFPDTGTGFFSFDRYLRNVGPVPANVSQIPAVFPLSFDDFLGARKSTPGTQNYDTAGTYTFTVPNYATMTVAVAGAGGGGASSVWDGSSFVGAGNPGKAGGDSSFLAIKAAGGSGAGASASQRYPYQVVPGTNGSPGGAVGGDVNTTGGGPIGGIGGSLISIGGGSNGDGGVGGTAGLSSKTYSLGAAGAPVPGSTVTVTVGAGGIPGPYPGQAGQPGKPGYVHISWT